MENKGKVIDVSIVMPVYKVKEYISTSVEAVCCQQFSGSYELILVDDGSPDNSIEIAYGVLGKYPKMQFSILHKKNGGLPSARNYGMQNAHGRYICFIDSDDVISTDYIQSLYDLNESEKLVLSYADFELTYAPNRNGSDDVDDGTEIINRDDLLIGFLNRDLKIHCCSIMFNFDYLTSNGYDFNENLRYGEDIEFMWRLLPHLSKIGHVKKRTYKYLQRPNSIMTSQSIEKIVILCDEFQKVVVANKKKFPSDKPIFNMLMGKAQLAFFRTSAETSSYRVFRQLLNGVDYKSSIKTVYQIQNKKLRLLAHSLILHPMCFYWVVNTNRKVMKK